jgi:2-polyprenyl-6-methoxyphenol hydroxylase-like FAD-dependent oxidoreductase
MKILVVGAGIAGSAFAAFAKKYDLGEVTLVDHAPEFRTIGYLIELWGNGRTILQKLGIDHEVAEERGFEYSHEVIRNRHGDILKSFALASLKASLPIVAIRRSDLHGSLVRLLTGIDIRFNTSIIGITQRIEKVEASFSDGTNDTFDLVVGADGTHSIVRDLAFGTGFLNYFGWGVWMYWLPESFHSGSDAMGYIGDGKICALLPLNGKSMGTLVAKVPRGTGKDLPTRRTQLAERFSEFCELARQIVDAAPASEEIYYDDVAYVEMPLWHTGRVALMGDAQHALSPVAGMGTSMALEDAYVLADELRKNKSDIDAVLVQYADRREKRMAQLRGASRRMDRWVMASGLLGRVRDAALPFVPTGYFMSAVRDFLQAEA